MKRILVIENDVELLEEISDILFNEGFDIAYAMNGEEGLEEAMVTHPDLILCDIMMPGKDGYEVLQEIHKSKDEKRPPFIFITALSDRQYFRQGMELGAHDYLTKPFTREELLNAIRVRLDSIERMERNVQQRINEFEKKIHARINQTTEGNRESGLLGDASFTGANSSFSERKSELLDEVMRLVESNQMISNLRRSIRNELRSRCSPQEKHLFLQLEKRIASPNFFWDNLTIFQQEFNKRFPGLLSQIENQYEHLSRHDLIFIAATYLELETHQIAGLLSITTESVRKSRYRIKKKLGLKENEDFYSYVKFFTCV